MAIANTINSMTIHINEAYNEIENKGVSLEDRILLLPDGYQEVNYLEFKGNSYVPIDVMFSTNVKMIANIITRENAEGSLFGITQLQGTYPAPLKNEVSFSQSSGKTICYITFSGSSRPVTLSNNEFTLTYNITEEKGTYTIDGVATDVTLRITGEFKPTNNIVIGASKNYSSAITNIINGICITNIKYIDEKTGDTVAELIPCYRKEDERMGLYNTITKTFNESVGDNIYYGEKKDTYIESSAKKNIENISKFIKKIDTHEAELLDIENQLKQI